MPGDPSAVRALNAVLGTATIWVGAFLSGFVINEPAPYELFMTGLIVIWLLAGLAIPRSAVFLLALLVAFNIGGVIATSQMTTLGTAPIYVAVSLFLALTSVFLASVIAARASYLSVIYSGWTAAAILTSLAGIAGYFSLLPGAEMFTLYGRAKGAFQDPNVFAPYLILPALYNLRAVLTGPRLSRSLIPITVLCVLTFGVFLSFSRAAWGLYLLCSLLLMAALFTGSSSSRFRLRMIAMSCFVLLAVAATLVIALQFESVRELFLERARLVQDYDAGPGGRFGHQITGFLLAMETPFGIGPLEFGRIYGADTHNIWLKSLFDYSWLGFAAYVTLLTATLAGGFRILFRDRPWQPYLLCAYIVFLGHVLIGNVIDTDHWRHFYVLLGIIWGCIALEARHVREASGGGAKEKKMVGAAGFEPTTP
ncbi:hypothetical protein E0D97_10050 [Oricola cellulosilytica]|uniref:O-antigen ligase domain-containing protein n=1 Tax=Oricola cellulosilytica TaxID=1429082 RepID=A0A4R0PGQ1_9HYPH|nr:hypothetical protein E0D97_10050 [Oricola cellulosilytica]